MTQAPIACPSCAARSVPADTGGTLHLWWPAGHVAKKLLETIRAAELPLTVAAGKRAEVSIGIGWLTPLCQELFKVLTPVERTAVRALFVPEGREAGLGALGEVTTLEGLAHRGTARWLSALLDDERLTSHFQPIVEAATGEPFAMEALVRGLPLEGEDAGPDGLIGGGHIIMAARAADMLFPVDLAARTSAVRTAVERGYRGRLFINFSPAAIYDPHHCLRSTVKIIESLRYPPENIVFEVGEGDSVESMDHLKEILTVYRSAGFKVALDDLGAGYASLNALHELRPDYVKMDMALVRGVDHDPVKAPILAGLLRMAREIGIATVCEGVETHAEADWLRAHGADYLQGFLYGRAAPAPPASGSGPLATRDGAVPL
ncbi:EAL domain-containing protein [Caenispirillum salinarum]|uniref:EAL domain-containing protein n=1 Tax=Caenispirillum salinarum TaxID=859058 RepID=UPI00384AF3F9